MGECEYDEKCKGAYYGSVTFSTNEMDFDEYECYFSLCEEHYHQMIEPMRSMQKKANEEWAKEIERKREEIANSGIYTFSEMVNLGLLQKTAESACDVLRDLSESFEDENKS